MSEALPKLRGKQAQSQGVSVSYRSRYLAYEEEKRRYLREHPEATQREYEKAVKEIVKRLSI